MIEDLFNPTGLFYLFNYELEEGGEGLCYDAGCLLSLGLLLRLPGTSSSSPALSGQRSRPLSHTYEDNLADREELREWL